MATPPVAYDLRVELSHITPPIWRRLRVHSGITLRELHEILQVAFGWTESHLHEFAIDGKRYGRVGPDVDDFEPPEDDRKAWLRLLLHEGDRFLYTYDFGDDWAHEIVVEKEHRTPPKPAPTLCLGGARAGPPEDCGGPLGYPDFLTALADPEHEEHDHLLEWVGGYFDPEGFDANAINRELKKLDAKRMKPRAGWYLPKASKARKPSGAKGRRRARK